MPPEAVPTSLSNLMHLYTNSSLEILVVLFAWYATMAEHTQNADELEIPDAHGMFPSISICSPVIYLFYDRSSKPAR
jgi:hypothetical protein